LFYYRKKLKEIRKRRKNAGKNSGENKLIINGRRGGGERLTRSTIK